MSTEARVVITSGPMGAYSGQQGLSSWSRTIVFTDGASEWLLVEGDGVRAELPTSMNLKAAMSQLAREIAGQGNYVIETREV